MLKFEQKAKNFVSLCVFLNDDLCNKSLNTLCTRLKLKEDIDLTAEGLNQHFNKDGPLAKIQLEYDILNGEVV